MSDPTRSVPYEQQLAEWARGKVAAGADPQAVTQKVTELTHAYRAKLATAPETPEPETTGDQLGGMLGSAYQGITMGAGNKIIPAVQAAGDFATGNGFDFGKRKQENDNVLNRYRTNHPVASTVQELGGSVLPMLATAGVSGAGEGGIIARALKMMGTGTAVGATSGALSADHLADVPERAAVGGLIGGAGAPLASAAGDIGANLANRTGITDKAANLLAKIGPTQDAAEAMGTRGQVNATMGQREDLLNALDQTGKSAGQTQLDRQADTNAAANVLYGAARQDRRVLDDPRLNALLNDPQVKPVMQAVSEIRSAMGNPLPRVAAPDNVPLALQKMGVTPERYQALVALGKSRNATSSGVDLLSPELMGNASQGIELPDPDALSKAKQYLSDAANGLTQTPLQIKKDQARALLPKIAQIRSLLHELSPDYKQADAFYADAMGQDEGYQSGYNAFQKAANPSGEQLRDNTTPAMAQQISMPRYATEPVDAMDNRAEAFRSGAKARAVSQVQGAPVDKNLSSVLNQSAFAPDQETQGVRSLMFDDPAKSAGFEDQLATMRGAADNAPSSATRGGVPTTQRGVLMRMARGLLQPPDMVSSGAGGRQIAAMQADPAVLASKVAAGKRGQALFDRLRQIGLLAPTSTAAQEIEP